MALRWVLALPFDAGSSDSNVAVDAGPAFQDWQSGTRLRARVRSGEGAKIFVGWFDSKLNEPCAFSPAEDGVLRCLPDNAAIVTYADSACTQPLDVSGVASAPAPLYGTSSDICDRAVYRGDGDVTALRNEYVRSTGGACTFTNQQGWEYGGATHVDPTEFVAATITTKPIDAALDMRVLVADDGATRVVGGHDRIHDVDCTPSLGAATPVCAPIDDWNAWSSCNGLARCSGAPKANAISVEKACNVQGVFVTSTGTCGTSAELTTYATGRTFAPPTLEQHSASGGRLHPLVMSRAGTTLLANAFWDDAIGDVCDGTRGACFPRAYEDYASIFSDDQCHNLVMLDDDCFGWLRRKDGYYQRAEPLPRGTQLFRGSAYGACTPISPIPGAHATTFYPLDFFVTLQDSVE